MNWIYFMDIFQKTSKCLLLTYFTLLMPCHKWSNLKLTLDDYKAILSCHVALSSYFNKMVEEKWKYLFGKIFQKFQMMPCVTFLGYHVWSNYCVHCSCINSSLDTCIKLSYFYCMKKYFIHHLLFASLVTYCLLVG